VAVKLLNYPCKVDTKGEVARPSTHHAQKHIAKCTIKLMFSVFGRIKKPRTHCTEGCHKKLTWILFLHLSRWRTRFLPTKLSISILYTASQHVCNRSRTLHHDIRNMNFPESVSIHLQPILVITCCYNNKRMFNTTTYNFRT